MICMYIYVLYILYWFLGLAKALTVKTFQQQVQYMS